MLISYNWLKWYIPEAPEAEKLADVITYHVAEVESVERVGDDTVFEIKILPNRAHDLLSHQGLAHELASLLNIRFKDPVSGYKVPESKPTKLIQKIGNSKCRRYMGRIVRDVKVQPSPDWVVKHLESIGQRSVNNIVDATNIVMYDCGQPAHVFALDKVKDLKLQIRDAKNGEKITVLGGAEKILNDTIMVIADDYGNSLDVAGIKGGRYAELAEDTTDIILECANFDPVSVRKTAQTLNIVTDAKKRFENDLSPELASYGMLELSALICEMCPDAIFEDIVDIYPQRQKERKLSFRVDKISRVLGLDVSEGEIEDILKRYDFQYNLAVGVPSGTPTARFEIKVPPMRLDLETEEDIAEEVGRIIGYDKIEGRVPKIDFRPKMNETYAKISWSRGKLLKEGYSEVMTYVFRDQGEVEVRESASDKKFLRTNLSDGLKESLKLNQSNLPLLDAEEIKIFEIGTVFLKDREEIHVAYGDKRGIQEMSLDKFCEDYPSNFKPEPKVCSLMSSFKAWSLFPFIVRDIAVWVPKEVESHQVRQVIKENAGSMVFRGPELFDSFTKGDQTSYAFRLVFQSYERTLKDAEVNNIMDKITAALKENAGWQVR